VTHVFDAYARYYDLLYRDKDYSAEAAYVVSQLRSHADGARSVLELGCGTGSHAQLLAGSGFDVHGVDLSSEMVARAEARKAELPSDVARRLSFETGDLRRFRTERVFDAVISLFHVISYQTSNEDLAAAFETAHSHLGKGGIFFFDFWYGPAVLTQRPDTRVRRLEDDEIGIIRIAEPVLHSARSVVDVHFTVFVENKATAVISRVHEVHSMRYLFLTELLQLSAPWFELVDFSAWMTSREPGTGDWAACAALRRK
jgi:SAM-dependent methyltransferase